MVVLTPYWSLDVFIVFWSAVAVAYFYMTRNLNHWNKKGVTEARPVPFFGNFLDCCLFRITPGMHFRSLYERGIGLPYLGFYIFDKPALLLRDPDVIKAVMVKDFHCFPDRYVSTHEADTIASGNMFLAKTPEWKSLRQSSTSIFTSGKMKGMFPLMSVVGNEMVTHLDTLDPQGDGRVIEVKDLSAKYTTDVIFACAFGLQAQCLNDPDSAYRKCGESVFGLDTYTRSAEFAGFFFAPAVVKFLNRTFFSKDAGNFMRKVCEQTMTLRMEGNVKRNDLIDTLIQMKNSRKSDFRAKGLDDDCLVGQAVTFFAAGFESSSNTMSFTLYELALQPNVQSRLRKEIISALEDSAEGITYDMIMNLSYLDMVVSETLRKYPFLPFLERIANRDYRVSGTNLVVEEGTPVYIPLLGLHYDPEYFPEPEKYDPERFSTDNKQKRPSCVYAPFGEGPRNCIGLRFGLLQSKLGIVKFILNFEVTACSQTRIPIRFDPKALLLASSGGLYLNARRITTTLSD